MHRITAAILVASVAGAAQAATPTFNKDVAPIVFAKCMACHRPGEVAPFPLTSYKEVRKRARQIALVTKRGIMPPWKPVDPRGTFKYDRSLTKKEIAVFQSWAAAGAPEGDAKDLPKKPKFRSGWALGKPDMVLKLPKPFKVHAEGKDIYVHFVFPMNLKKDRYIKAVQVLPSNPSVAHHGVILLDGSKAARRQAKKHGGSHYFNFGDPGFIPRGFLPGYAPGIVTVREEETKNNEVGLTLGKGLDIVLQMHYHPTGKPETDQPQIGLYFTDVKPKRGPNIIAMANNDISIPPGARKFTRTDSFKLPVDFKVSNIWGHMHMIGKTMKVWAELPDGSKRQLLKIDDWDFNWQDTYHYTKPFVLPRGTVVKSVWTWDNTKDNPRNPWSPPRRIKHGPDSTDEMTGLIIGGVTVRRGLDEAIMWGAVIGHYFVIERRTKAAEKRRKAAAGR